MIAARKKKQRPPAPAAPSTIRPAVSHDNHDAAPGVTMGDVPASAPPPARQHARVESDSSAFDLCGGTPDGVASPTEEGEYLVL